MPRPRIDRVKVHEYWQQGLTAEVVAKRLGCSRHSVTRLFSGFQKAGDTPREPATTEAEKAAPREGWLSPTAAAVYAYLKQQRELSDLYPGIRAIAAAVGRSTYAVNHHLSELRARGALGGHSRQGYPYLLREPDFSREVGKPAQSKTKNCLKCGSPFISFDPKKNRICPSCSEQNRNSARICEGMVW